MLPPDAPASPIRLSMSTPEEAAATAWRALTDIAEVQRRRTLVIARDLGLTPPQMWMLRYLEPGRGKPMNAFTTALVCESSNVTGMADRLEQRGLVERRPSPEDRRIRVLMLTPAGRRLRREIVRRVAEPAAGFAEGTDLEALAALLEQVAAAVVDADGLALPPAGDARPRAAARG